MLKVFLPVFGDGVAEENDAVFAGFGGAEVGVFLTVDFEIGGVALDGQGPVCVGGHAAGGGAGGERGVGEAAAAVAGFEGKGALRRSEHGTIRWRRIGSLLCKESQRHECPASGGQHQRERSDLHRLPFKKVMRDSIVSWQTGERAALEEVGSALYLPAAPAAPRKTCKKPCGEPTITRFRRNANARHTCMDGGGILGQ